MVVLVIELLGLPFFIILLVKMEFFGHSFLHSLVYAIRDFAIWYFDFKLVMGFESMVSKQELPHVELVQQIKMVHF